MSDKPKSIQMSIKVYPPVHRALMRLSKKLGLPVNWLINTSIGGLAGINPAELEYWRKK